MANAHFASSISVKIVAIELIIEELRKRKYIYRKLRTSSLHPGKEREIEWLAGHRNRPQRNSYRGRQAHTFITGIMRIMNFTI
jgi:hypothetical protein